MTSLYEGFKPTQTAQTYKRVRNICYFSNSKNQNYLMLQQIHEKKVRGSNSCSIEDSKEQLLPDY